METPGGEFEPNEPVLWRSKTVREYVRDMVKSSGWLLAIGFLLPILFRNSSAFIIALMPLGIACVIAFDVLVPLPDRLLLTGRQLLVRRGFRKLTTSILTRKHIAGLEIFGGDGGMILHGRHGELDRVRFLGDPLDLARELNLPTRVWHPYEPLKQAGRRRVVKILSWFVVPTAILVVLFGGMAGVLSTVDFYLGPDYIRSTYSIDTVGFIGMIFSFALFSLGYITGGIAMGGIRRLVMTPRDLALLRCEKSDPFWLGEMPVAPPQSGLRRITHALQQGYNRLAYGPPAECAPPEPERIEPGAFPPPEDEEEG